MTACIVLGLLSVAGLVCVLLGRDVYRQTARFTGDGEGVALSGVGVLALHLGHERWSAIDDLQLTRLLRSAAESD